MKRLSSRHVLIIAGGFAGGFALAWWLLVQAGTPAAPPRHVVVITLDTTRADALGAYGASGASTPHLDALAARGVRFADAVTTAPITGPAHAALFTGRYPARLGVRDNATTPLPDEAVTITERLRDAGFVTGGFIGAFVLDRPYGFAQGFDAFSSFARVDSGSEATAERDGAAVVDDAVRWLSGVPIEERFFLWVHLYDPHAPYAAPDPFGRGFAARPYDGEVAYADHQVGRLVETLRTRGVLDATLIVAIADHGESLGEHGEDEHGVFLYESVLRVPWIIAGSGIDNGRVVTEQVRGIDLMPTVIDLLGLPADEGADGESLLLQVMRGRARKVIPAAYAESYYPRFHYGWSELRALRADGFKVIDAPRAELFAVRTDPKESTNRYETQRALADRMIDEARRLEQALTSGRTEQAPAPDSETLARLRSLGYIGTSAPTPPTGERLPDPKDRIEERRAFKRLLTEAIDDLGANRLDAAAGTLRDLIRINERAYDLHQLLGEVYRRQGRLPEALGEFEMAALLNAAVASPHLSAAEVLLAMGRPAEAARRVETAASLAPDSFDAALVRGQVLEAEGRLDEAVAAYERGVALNPANPRVRLLLAVLASRTKRLDLAEQQLQQLLTMGYQPSRTHVALGQVAEMRGDRTGARRQYEQALAIEPGLPIALAALARLR